MYSSPLICGIMAYLYLICTVYSSPVIHGIMSYLYLICSAYSSPVICSIMTYLYLICGFYVPHIPVLLYAVSGLVYTRFVGSMYRVSYSSYLWYHGLSILDL